MSNTQNEGTHSRGKIAIESLRKWILSPIVGISVAAAVGFVTLAGSLADIFGFKLENMDAVKAAIAIVGGILGSVLGYYFGQKKNGGKS